MRWALLIVIVMSAGCGVSLRSSLDAWHPSGRVSQLDEADRALLARMVVDTPTDDAMDAREHIDELGEVGDDDVRALLVSSLQWMEGVPRTLLDELRDERCDASHRPETGPRVTHDDDVMGDLSEQRWTTDGVSIRRLAMDEHMALGVLWERVDFRDVACARTYRALRAVAIVRAWLGAHVDDSGVLDVFRIAVERITGASTTCRGSQEGDIDVAIGQHFHQIDPRPWLETEAVERDAPCQVITLAGPHRGPRRSSLAPLRSTDTTSSIEADDVIGALADRSETITYDLSTIAVRPGELAFEVEVRWGTTFAWVAVVRRGGEWRVVEAVYAGQVCIENYRPG